MPRSSKQFTGEYTGFMTPKAFEETILLLFATKKEFAEFTGISQAQVQRYTAGVSPIPKSVALLALSMGMLRRHGIALPDLAEVGVVHLDGEDGYKFIEVGSPDVEIVRVRRGPGRPRKSEKS